jgi:uncharacterized membrane protein YoaK (UPF0700 family)
VPRTPASRIAPKDLDELLLALLAFGSGAVDAISYLGLGKVFTANMTGNIVLLGLAASRSEGPVVLRSAVSLAVFIVGVFAATRIATRSPRLHSWLAVRASLVLEVTLQAAFLAAWVGASGHPGLALEVVLVALSALAMGFQSGAVRMLGIGVSTTYVTGTLAGLIGGLAASSGSRRDLVRRAMVVASLLVGALCAGLAVVYLRTVAPVLPLAVTLIVTAAAHAFFGRPDVEGAPER